MTNEQQIFTWDWKEQPDWSAIGRAVAEASGGRVSIRPVETGDDSYAVVVSAADADACPGCGQDADHDGARVPRGGRPC